MSTSEAKYVVTLEACKATIWLSSLVGDLGITVEMSLLHYDSQSAIQLAKNLVFHVKTKHVVVKFHSIQEILSTCSLSRFM